LFNNCILLNIIEPIIIFCITNYYIAVALGVSVKSLFEPMGDEAVEGFIKIRGKIYQFNSRSELENLLK
jgi:hypothetical protein